jgi:hypothetical protein
MKPLTMHMIEHLTFWYSIMIKSLGRLALRKQNLAAAADIVGRLPSRKQQV